MDCYSANSAESGHNNEATMDEEIFVMLLADRIDQLRLTFDIDEDYQLKGPRFLSTAYVVEAIQGSIVMRKNPRIRGAVLKESVGLEFDPAQVESGQFDAIIRIVLKHLACLDFEIENRVDLN